MKKLFYVIAVFAASLLLLSCGKKEPSSVTILQSTQWYDDDGGVWDIGMSFSKHYMWWDQNAEISVDQFLAPYVITTLSDGRVPGDDFLRVAVCNHREITEGVTAISVPDRHIRDIRHP